jgi:outer membrane protein
MTLLRPLLRLIPLACAALAGLPAQAQSPSELYLAARAHDATYQAARAQLDAAGFRSEQARAGLLPQAALQSSISQSHFNNSVSNVGRGFGTQGATLTASHPLFRPANAATFAQGLRQFELARAQLESAGQDLILRVSQAYFDVLAAQDTLAFVQAQKTAVNEQLAAARRNFEVGTATITDTREAQARFDLVTAQEIAAENDLRVRRLNLESLVGRTGVQPLPLAVPVPVAGPQPADVDAWVRQSEEASPAVQQARRALEIARLETEKARAGQLPTVDVVASHNLSNNPAGSAVTPASSRTHTTQVGLTLNLPLFTGYSVQNRIRETRALEERAQADLDAARRNVAQATRAAYFGVVSGAGQVRALEAAESSSQLALDANRLGYQVGVRINIDVLNAQSQLFQTKRDLAVARYNVLLGQLRLRQANGTLSPVDLVTLDALVVRP